MRMMRITINTFFIFLLLIVSPSLKAQEQDFQTRFGIDAEGDIIDDLAWGVKVQQRWRYNSSVNDRTLLQGEIEYSPLSFLSVGVGYRASFVDKQEDGLVYKQRFQGDLALDHRIDRFKFTYRSRLQYGFDDFQTLYFVEGESFTWRHRLAVKYYPFGLALRPQASVEIFQKVNAPDERGLDGIRYILGAEYLLSHQMSVGLDYIFNKEMNVSNPLTEHTLSASLSYEF